MAADWPHSLAPMLAAFLASLVECVEALTVVLAVGTVRGWRDALLGTAAALLVLLALILLLGPSLARIPLRGVQLVVGTLLLLFGMRWLRKAMLRSAGVIPLHDEAAAYVAQRALLAGAPPRLGRHDTLAMLATFKITLLEGLEVVFIIIALAAGGAHLWVPASLGALAALLLVAALGLLVHRPLARIPENTLKFGVGILLTSFGSFWAGEGIGVHWPAADWSLPGLAVGYLLVALLGVAASRHARLGRIGKTHTGSRLMSTLGYFGRELLAFFVDDGRLAVRVLAWLAVTWLAIARLPLPAPWPALTLFTGLALILTLSVLRRARSD